MNSSTANQNINLRMVRISERRIELTCCAPPVSALKFDVKLSDVKILNVAHPIPEKHSANETSSKGFTF